MPRTSGCDSPSYWPDRHPSVSATARVRDGCGYQGLTYNVFIWTLENRRRYVFM